MRLLVVVRSLFAVLVVTSFLSSTPAYAAVKGTNLTVSICGSSAGSGLTITTPVSDSVVNQATITLSGTVLNATQIEVRVDGQYSSTIPLNASDVSYTMQLTLTVGTHTILLTANDVCGISNASSQTVVTYQPGATQTTGSATPTNSGGGQKAFRADGISISADDGLKPADGVVIKPGVTQANTERVAIITIGQIGLSMGDVVIISTVSAAVLGSAAFWFFRIRLRR